MSAGEFTLIRVSSSFLSGSGRPRAPLTLCSGMEVRVLSGMSGGGICEGMGAGTIWLTAAQPIAARGRVSLPQSLTFWGTVAGGVEALTVAQGRWF